MPAHFQLSLEFNQAGKKFAKIKNDYYVKPLAKINESDTYPRVVPFIKKIRAKNVKVGSCSSSRNAKTVLDKLCISSLFDVVITGADVTKAKPDPEIFLLVATKLRIPPERCLVFEDAVSGVEAANFAKMKCVGVGTPELLPNASMCISDYSKIDISAMLGAN